MSQQLVKKGANGRYSNVMPKSWIEAIKDKNTGKTLLEILQSFNMYFLPYDNNSTSTRCLVPTMLRKKGLWITYVKYDGNVYTEWYAADEIDDKSWGDSSNWRIGNNTLVGDITISANGNWVINGTETEFKAVGEKGNTPLVRFGSNNKFQVSYNNGEKWLDISDSITNNLRIKKYIGINESLPTSGIEEGTIYMKGPYYAEDDTLNDNPIYRMWVYAWKGNTLAWQDNGEFTSIAAGIVQETGDSETKVMSQKATSNELSKIEAKVNTDILEISGTGTNSNPISYYYEVNAKKDDLFIFTNKGQNAMSFWLCNEKNTSNKIDNTNISPNENLEFIASSSAKYLGVYMYNSDSFSFLKKESITYKLEKLNTEIFKELTNVVGVNHVNTYINVNSKSWMSLEGYNVIEFNTVVGTEYTLTIPKSGNGLMASLMNVTSKGQSSDLPTASAIGSTEEQIIKVKATTEWIQCTYDASGGTPTLSFFKDTSLREEVRNIEKETLKNKETSNRIIADTLIINGSASDSNFKTYWYDVDLYRGESFVFYNNGQNLMSLFFSNYKDASTAVTKFDNIAPQEYKKFTLSANEKYFGVYAKGSDSFKLLKVNNITDKVNNLENELFSKKIEVKGNITTDRYINANSQSLQYLNGYAVIEFEVIVGETYDLFIPKSGNTVMLSYVFSDSKGQTSELKSNAIGNTGEQYFRLTASSKYIKCTYDISGDVPVLYHIKNNNNFTIIDKNVLSPHTIKKDYYANQTNGNLYYLAEQNWSTAIYKVEIGKTYNIYIPKSGNAACASVAWGNSASSTSGLVLEGYCFGNEDTQIFNNIIAKTEYLYSTFNHTENAPELFITEVIPLDEAVKINRDKIHNLLGKNYVTISLAKEYDLTVGEKFELFFRGIFSGLNPDNFEFSVDFGTLGFKGNHYNEKWEWTPLESHIGSYPITIKAYSDGGLISSATTTLNVNANELTSENKVCLLIGDSLMYDSNKGTIAGEVYRRICTNEEEHEADGVVYPKGYGKTNFRFIGQIQSIKQPNAYSVGVGGWTAKYYNEKSERFDYQYIVCSHDKTDADQHSVYEDSEGVQWKLESIEDGRIKVYIVSGQYPMRILSGTLTWVSGGQNHSDIIISSASVAPGNPFWINDKVDFAAYASSKGVSSIDYVVIELGTNNMNTPDNDILNQTKTLIDNILLSYPNCKISLMTTHMSVREGWYGSKDTYYDWVQFCVKIKSIYESLLNIYPSSLKVIDMAAMLDNDRCCGWSYMNYNARYRGNAPSYRKIFLNNALHPNYAGYMMIADMIVRDMVARF